MNLRILVILTAIITLFFQITYFTHPIVLFNNIENREMSLFPKFKINNIENGKFQNQIEDTFIAPQKASNYTSGN
jgi:hypothetical protein